MGTSIESLRKIINSRRQKFISKYINLECQNEQFDILLQKLHEIADSRAFENIQKSDDSSITKEIKSLIKQQKEIQSKISIMKSEIINPSINIMN